MPELPEVETVKRQLQPWLLNQTIIGFVIRSPKLRWPIDQATARNLQGHKIIEIQRRGKYLILSTDKSWAIIIHLGMSGFLRLLSQPATANKHEHFDLIVSDKDNAKQATKIRYHDTRKFGALLFCPQAELAAHPLLRNLGPEPLERDFTAEKFFAKLQKTSTNIKTAIMNAKNVVGVGNIYANEALFQAGIHPLRPANSLNISEIAALVAAIKQILQQAIIAGGTTLKDFSGLTGQPGYFSNNCQVYGREQQACNRCQQQLQALRIQNRATVYCQKCQPHYIKTTIADINYATI